MRLLLPEAHYLQGKTLLNLNQGSLARKRLSEGRKIAKAIGSRRMLWRISFTLSQLEEDIETARQLRREARQTLEFILTQFHQEHRDLRDSFREQADVQAVMEKIENHSN